MRRGPTYLGRRLRWPVNPNHMESRLRFTPALPVLIFALTTCGDDAATPDATPQPMIDSVVSDAPACVANTTTCVGDAIVACGADGSPTSTTECPLGCDPGGGATAPRCNVLTPSNLAAGTCDAAGATDLILASGTTTIIDTGGGNCSEIIAQTGGRRSAW